jgi:putative ABC transport system substrate-binding protein
MGAVVLAPSTVLAQSPVTIGWLTSRSRESSGYELTAFREGMAALGWKEGSRIVLEERWADGHYERLPGYAREIAAKKPAVIVAVGGQAVTAAAQAAPTTPIVMATGSDPVAAGFARSLSRPGGMITGVSNVEVDFSEKLLELLLAAVPRIRRVGFLVNPSNVNYAQQVAAARRSAARQRVEAFFGPVNHPADIEATFAHLASENVQALIVLGSSLFQSEGRRIGSLALTRRWPTISAQRALAEQGMLLAYGHDPDASFRRAAFYVDRILKGARPGELPIEQPTRVELIVNLKTAKALGLSVPQSILVRADRVIE